MTFPTITWLTDPDFTIMRQQCQFIAWGWWQHTLIESGVNLVTRETPFGGYTEHIEINPDFWQWSSSSFQLSQCIDNIYANPPGLTSIITGAPVQIQFKYVREAHGMGIVISNTSGGGYYSFNRLPQAPADYWGKPTFCYDWTYKYNPPSGAGVDFDDLYDCIQ